jgi:hypothetical protein
VTDPAVLPAVAAPKRAAPHNQFLDLVRTVAIIRVLAWHTYGFAWLSYLIASMPAMFFVAGSLMAHSLERSSVRKVFYARFRRLLIPLWAFGLVLLSGMVLHSATQTELGLPVRWERCRWSSCLGPAGERLGITFWAVRVHAASPGSSCSARPCSGCSSVVDRPYRRAASASPSSKCGHARGPVPCSLRTWHRSALLVAGVSYNAGHLP